MALQFLPAADLDHILEYTRDLWEELKNARLFITGGTGFFGRWLLHSLAWADDKFGLGIRVLVLSRNPELFAGQLPGLAAHSCIRFHPGNVESFAFPEGGFSHVIHAAAPVGMKISEESPSLLFNAIVKGTGRTLDFAKASGAKEFLFMSSGAVYGNQPPEMTHVTEAYAGGPDSVYGMAKRDAEVLCVKYRQEFGIETRIARCFAFVGPYLPLDARFAVGNFIHNGLAGGPIQILGDGAPFRSYLYPSDLIVWLLTIFLRGEPGRPYNVGSEEAHSIADIARIVAKEFGVEVKIAQTTTSGKPVDRYVPSTQRARSELGLKQTIGLDEAIRKTIQWYLKN